MIKYLIWTDSWNEEQGAVEIEAFSPRCAAEEWVEGLHADWDYCEEANDIFVRDPDGVVTRWDVFVESRPHFRAVEQKDVTEKPKGV